MLHDYVMLYYMARGESGRIVLEIDPSQKGELYSALTKDGLTLKNWFLKQAEQYLRDRFQMPLFGEAITSDEAQHVRVSPSKAKSNRIKAKSK
jgi:hypothetical protein